MPLPDIIHHFISQQKVDAIIFICIGSIAIFFALFFLRIIKYSFFKGMAITLLLFGAIEVLEGTHELLSKHKIINSNDMITNKKQIEDEISTIKFYTLATTICFIIGTLVYSISYKSTQTFWKGLALGLMLQTGIMLTLFLVKQMHYQIIKNKFAQYEIK